jgi:hypothetical protein
MRKWAITGAVAGVAVGTGSAMAANMPISLASGSFNQNVVMGSGNGTYTAVTAGMDGGVYALPGSNYSYYTVTLGSGTVVNGYFSATTFYTQGYNSGAMSTGIPLGQTITSASNPDTTFTLSPVLSTYNASVLTEQTTQSRTNTITLASPAAYSSLAFLGADQSNPINYTINFQGGGTQTGVLAFDALFPGSGTPYAYAPGGRINMTGTTDPSNNSVTLTGVGGFDGLNNLDGPFLTQVDVAVTDTADPVESITFSMDNTNGAGTTYESDAIFAVSGQIVPEPATLSLIGIGAAGMLMKRRRRTAQAAPENPMAELWKAEGPDAVPDARLLLALNSRVR